MTRPRRAQSVGGNDPELLAAPAGADAEGERAVIPKTAEGTGWVRAGRRVLVLVLVTSRQRAPARWGAGASLDAEEAAQVLLDVAPAAGDRAQAEALGRRQRRIDSGISARSMWVRRPRRFLYGCGTYSASTRYTSS